MMYISKNISSIWPGLVLVFFSLILFLSNTVQKNTMFSEVFFLQYGIACFYFIILLSRFRFRLFRFFSNACRKEQIILFILFTISALSLNQIFTLFYDPAPWLAVFLISEYIILLIIAFYDRLPGWISFLITIIITAAMIFHIYQVIILLPFAGFALLGLIFLGIGIHLYVPLFGVLITGAILYKQLKNPNNRWAFLISVCLILFSGTVIIAFWVNTERQVRQTLLMAQDLDGDRQLPEWVHLSQHLENDWLTKLYLSHSITHQQFDYSGSDLSRSGMGNVHDPLVTVASLFLSPEIISEEDRLAILNFMYDNRHETADRFWSGNDLRTHSITTNIELFPEERVSYTELTLTIANISNQFWNRQQEALYTFQLPEGGVVSSLSLWVNGKEEKGILTSRQKADSAYSAIVGRERRDPAIVYWMEGNSIRLRVFPCTPDENRKVKMGITAPLAYQDHLLRYVPPSMKGPSTSEALSAIHILGKGKNIKPQGIMLKHNDNGCSWRGNYTENWALTISAPVFKPRSFIYKGETYTTSELRETSVKFAPKRVIFDLSSSFTQSEIDHLLLITKDLEQFYLDSDGEIKRIKNHLKLKPSDFPEFTLFPIFNDYSSSNTLVITKGGMSTPNLSDLQGSTFSRNLLTFFSDNEEVPKVFDLNSEATSYLRSLEEFGVINRVYGNLHLLTQCLKTQSFPFRHNGSEKTTLKPAGITITKGRSIIMERSYSDHLLRLFSYDQVLKGIGKDYFSNPENPITDEKFITMSQQAHIVTPVSGLLVLETKEDYERFGIEGSKNSLGNAAINNSGAVPEPHEWALILTVALFVIVALYKRFKGSSLC